MSVGFKHIFFEGKICPDMHLDSSSTIMHPRLEPTSPTKHHPILLDEMGFWIGFAVVSSFGSFIVFDLEIFKAASKLRVSTPFLLADISRFPTLWTAPSATSIPALAVSDATSAVVLITAPVVYPNRDKIGLMMGVKMAMNVLIALLI